jgi:predicted nucleic acid-binding protein
MIVVADSSSLNYLVLIARIDILQELYGRIYIPESVVIELSDVGAPSSVRSWVRNLPAWIESRSLMNDDSSISSLGRGEQDGIALAHALNAQLILLDDRAARKTAIRQGITVTGTLGVLGEAAKAGLIDLEAAIAELRQTNFRASDSLISEVLQEGRK